MTMSATDTGETRRHLPPRVKFPLAVPLVMVPANLNDAQVANKM